MDFRIQNRIAIVCGGSAGLGFAAARALSSEGVRVAICGRTLATLEKAAETIHAETGCEVLPVVADVSKPEDCEALVKRVEAELGTVDILINNSGGPTPGLFDNKGDGEWAEGVEATLMNVVRMIRLVLPGMKQKGWGRILSITSSSVKEPVGSLLLSNSIRPAVHGLTKSLSVELGADGITINTIQPGYFLTERLEEVAKANAEKKNWSTEEELKALASSTPVRRLGKPKEFGEAIAFLCSEQAAYITGTTLLVDGGRTAGTSY